MYLKNYLWSVLLLIFCSTNLFAQAPLGNGGKQFNGGFGFSDFGVPIYLGLDFGVHPDITVGPQVSFRSYSESFTDQSGNKLKFGHSIFVMGFNGNYHFNSLLDISSEWDFYAGATLAYWVWSSPSGYLGTNGSGMGLNGQIGGRYFFSDKVAFNLQFGGGTATGGRFGLTVLL